jgi:hypothetical protein
VAPQLGKVGPVREDLTDLGAHVPAQRTKGLRGRLAQHDPAQLTELLFFDAHRMILVPETWISRMRFPRFRAVTAPAA